MYNALLYVYGRVTYGTRTRSTFVFYLFSKIQVVQLYVHVYNVVRVQRTHRILSKVRSTFESTFVLSYESTFVRKYFESTFEGTCTFESTNRIIILIRTKVVLFLHYTYTTRVHVQRDCISVVRKYLRRYSSYLSSILHLRTFRSTKVRKYFRVRKYESTFVRKYEGTFVLRKYFEVLSEVHVHVHVRVQYFQKYVYYLRTAGQAFPINVRTS